MQDLKFKNSFLWPSALILLSGLLITVFCALLLKEVALERDREKFNHEVDAITKNLEIAFAAAGDSLFEIQQSFSKPICFTNLSNFESIIHNLPNSFTNTFTGVGVAVLLSQGEVSSHVSWMRTCISSNYDIFPKSDGIHIHIRRDENEASFSPQRYYMPVIKYLRLPRGFGNVCCPRFELGNDLFSINTPAIHHQAKRIVSTISDGTLKIGAVLGSSESEINIFNELLFYFPFYRGGPSHYAVASTERFQDFAGVIFGTIDVEAIVLTTMKGSKSKLNLKMYYGEKEISTVIKQNMIYTSNDPFAAAPYQSASREFVACGKYLFLEMQTSGEWLRAGWYYYPTYIGLLGSSLALIVMVMFWKQLRRWDLIKSTDEELRSKNAALAATGAIQEKITRELHDNTLQYLFALGLNLQSCKRLLHHDSNGLSEGLDRGLADIREISGQLRKFITFEESEISPQNYHLVFKSIAQRFQLSSNCQISVNFGPKQLEEIESAQIIQLSHIMIEAISNAINHGKADLINVDFGVGASLWTFEIKDNGVGFPGSDPKKTGRFGLQNMKRRAESIGATFLVLSNTPRGIIVCVRWQKCDRGLSG